MRIGLCDDRLRQPKFFVVRVDLSGMLVESEKKKKKKKKDRAFGRQMSLSLREGLV